MKNTNTDIVNISIQFSLQVIGIYRQLKKDEAGKILGNQFLRAGTSIGVNIHDAQGAQSKADFIAKMSIAHKEARETAYWIQLFKEAELLFSDMLQDISVETTKIIKILSSILLTSIRNATRSKNHPNILLSPK